MFWYQDLFNQRLCDSVQNLAQQIHLKWLIESGSFLHIHVFPVKQKLKKPSVLVSPIGLVRHRPPFCIS